MSAAWVFLIVLLVPFGTMWTATRRERSRMRRLRQAQARHAALAAWRREQKARSRMVLPGAMSH